MTDGMTPEDEYIDAAAVVDTVRIYGHRNL